MQPDLKGAQSTTAVGVFQTHEEAARAVADLEHAGFRDEQISLVCKNKYGGVKMEGNKAGVGAATGATVGAGAAALASLGMTFGVIPVIGPILAVDHLAAALISAVGGAAAGTLVGGLLGLGLPHHEARYHEGEVQSGSFLVTVHDAERTAEAGTILQGHGSWNYGTGANAMR
jgi:hypothetical protein